MDQELTAQESELLSHVPENGDTVGNVSLIRALRWDDQQYWKIRNELLNKGILTTERGRGGSVRRVKKDEAVQELKRDEEFEETKPAGTPTYSEEMLYEPVAKVLSDRWIKDYRIDDFVLEITAKQGRRETGGTWSRPDIVVVSVSTYAFVPGKHLDVTSFEIKPYTSVDVTAIYEALAHLRAATRAFVLFHVPTNLEKVLAQRLEDVFEEANRHGVGLIVAQDVDDYETWDFRVEAIRRETDPMKLNDFTASQLSPEAKLKLQKWCR